MTLTLDQINQLSVADFTETFKDIAEHSPWVATQAAASRPFSNVAQTVMAFKNAVASADQTAQLNLIIAHPDLAGKAKLTKDSQNEQQGAGLDTLTADEMAEFTKLNDAYKSKFQFPFIYAVKGSNKHMILDSFRDRIDNEKDVEFQTALDNIYRILMFRLEDQIQA